ncbi:AzlD domain-containing protein [Miniimonas arenae]|uniref:AzlD domain-containing protein n=1 Tax=Miniimonas arenae TaxID=676201 RepID=A0A5C5BCZ4_9MICO|nr:MULTISPECIES: AzlD domain-containing protein [Miniimonas]TNU74132.1 AzlD domain-containing protein [Miniimonas arenae]
MSAVVAAGLLLALGTYATRRLGVELGGRVLGRAAQVEQLLEQGVVALLIAVTASAAVYDGAAPDGWARPVGVGLALGAAAVRAPLVVSVLLGAGATALLRLLGL